MRHADPAAVAPPVTAADLPDDTGLLKQMILELLASMHERDRDFAAMRHRIDLLLRRLYGPRGERVDPHQLLLFAAAAPGQDPPPPPPEATAEAKPRPKCRPHGRRRLPEDLPRVPHHHVLTEAQRLCPGCGQRRQEIGIDRSEQLDYKPASLFVIEHFVHKYACPCCRQGAQQAAASPGEPATGQEPMTSPAETPPGDGAAAQPPQTPPTVEPAGVVVAAAKPAMPIAKGLPGPGLLAHVIVSKYVDHLPLYRLESIYERQGMFLPRSTLCDWLMACGQLLRPLYDRLVFWALRSAALHTDDTPVKMQELLTHVLSTARLWGYLGDAAQPYNVFDFTPNRKRDGPQQFLAGYRGYLHADAFSGYDGLYLPDPLSTQARILEVACNAHARRKFYEARGSDVARSHQALAYYRQLYELERQAKDYSEAQRLQIRQDLAVPILETFHGWIEKEHPRVLPKSPMAEALGYARNNWAALVRYTEAGFLAIDNNAAEREMKRIAIGRKNWLFVGSPQGGRTAAVLMSFTSTCNRLEVEPWSYLQDVLSRLPGTPAGQLDDLLPDRWQAARRISGTVPPPGAPDATTVPSPKSDS